MLDPITKKLSNIFARGMKRTKIIFQTWNMVISFLETRTVFHLTTT